MAWRFGEGMHKRLLIFSVLFFALGSMPVQAADLAGVVSFSAGEAWLLRGKAMRPVPVDTKVYPGDVVVTKRTGRVRLSMRDGSIIYVGGRSRIAIRDYALKKFRLMHGSFRLLWGKARFYVTKLLGDAAGFEVETKTATIGVRGTQFAVIYPRVGVPTDADIAAPSSIDVKPATTQVMLFEGAVVARDVKGTEHVIKPGTLASIQASGRVFVRPILKPDVDELGLEPIQPEAKGKGGDKKTAPKDRKVEVSKPKAKEKQQLEVEKEGGKKAKSNTTTSRVPLAKKPKAENNEIRTSALKTRTPEVKKPERETEAAKKPDVTKADKIKRKNVELKKTRLAKVKIPEAEASKVKGIKLKKPKVEAPKVESVKVETPKVEAPKVESVKVETPKVEAPKVESVKVETPKVEAPKVESVKVETPKVEVPKVESVKVETPKVEVPKVEVEGIKNAAKQAEEAAKKAKDAAEKAKDESKKKKKD